MPELAKPGNPAVAPALPAETLAGIAIFRDLALGMLAALLRRCAWHRYAPGRMILQRQDERRDVFSVVSGRGCAIYHSAFSRKVRFCALRRQTSTTHPIETQPAPSAPALVACCDDGVPGSDSAAAERQALNCHWSLTSARRLECRWQRAGTR
jgi:hypothetical protein